MRLVPQESSEGSEIDVDEDDEDEADEEENGDREDEDSLEVPIPKMSRPSRGPRQPELLDESDNDF